MVLLNASAVFQISIDANQFNDFLVLGYFAMGLIALVYIVSLYLRQRNLKRDLELMKRILQEDDEGVS